MASLKGNPKRSFREAEESSVNVFLLVVALAAITLTCFLLYALLAPVLLGEQTIEILPFGGEEATPLPSSTFPPAVEPSPTLAGTSTPPPPAVPTRIRTTNVERLEPLAALPGPGAAVSSVEYSPDGGLIAAGERDGAIHVWDATTLAAQHTFQSGSNRVDTLAFSPDGALLIAGGQDSLIRRWDLVTGDELAPFSGPVAAVNAVAYSADGAWIAAASDDGMVYLLNAATGGLEALLTGHTDYVTSVAFDPSGATVAAGGVDDTIRLWSVPSGISLGTLRGHTSNVTDVAFSPDGSLLASVGADRALRLWSVLSVSPLAELTGHTENVTSLAFSPDSQLVATGAGGISDNAVRLWSVPNRAELHRVTPEGPVNSVEFSPDGLRLAVAGATFLTLWGVEEEATAPAASVELMPTFTLAPTQAPAAAPAAAPAGQGGQDAACVLTVRLPDVTLRASADEAAAVVGSLSLEQQVPLAAWARGADGYTWWLLASGGWARGDAFVNEANPTLPDDCWTLPPANQASVPALEGTSAPQAAQAAPAPGGGCVLTVRVLNANVRAGPDTSHDVVEQLAEGAQVQAVGWASGAEGFTWWQLASGGWARGDVFDAQSLAQACRDLPRSTP